MKQTKGLVSTFSLLAGIILALSALANGNDSVQNIAEFNQKLPSWGVSWKSGSSAVNGYYPSFYTGFAARTQSPERIHVRLARGNQTRVSVILDEKTLGDYLFDLVKRYRFYSQLLDSSNGRAFLNSSPSGAAMLPQADYFSSLIESPEYQILETVRQAETLGYRDEEIYAKAPKTLKALNPGRVFILNIDLKKEFKRFVQLLPVSFVPAADSPETIIALNNLVFGRINLTQKPSPAIIEKLKEVVGLAQSEGAESVNFMRSAVELFKLVTGSKYQFKILNSQGSFQDVLQCESPAEMCLLSYPEFTAIYPTGSVMAQTKDQFGNSIASFATPGLWQFLSRGSAHDVDNIREEPYYGWAPKLDYQAVGNGFHNPAVRFQSVSSAVKEALGIPANHSTLWSVKRGGVSHGCSRLPLGHVWELRHIFPVENSLMTGVHHFGNRPQDFDVYDINGDGELEVMGVQYFISYGLQGTSDLAKREGTDLEISSDRKLQFYENLYGTKNVFMPRADGSFLFLNPTLSYPSHLDFKKTQVSARMTLAAAIPLYEAAYEQDKVQFYAPPTTDGLTTRGASPYSKRIVRLMVECVVAPRDLTKINAVKTLSKTKKQNF